LTKLKLSPGAVHNTCALGICSVSVTIQILIVSLLSQDEPLPPEVFLFLGAMITAVPFVPIGLMLRNRNALFISVLSYVQAGFFMTLSWDVIFIFTAFQFLIYFVCDSIFSQQQDYFLHQLRTEAQMAHLMMEAEKQRACEEEMRFIQEKQAAERAAELKENHALKEKGLTQQRLHNQDIQRLKQISINERLEQEANILKIEAAELRLQKQALELEKETAKKKALHIMNHAAKRSLLSTIHFAERGQKKQHRLHDTAKALISELQTEWTESREDPEAACVLLSKLLGLLESESAEVLANLTELTVYADEGLNMCTSVVLLEQINSGEYELNLTPTNIREFLAYHFSKTPNLRLHVSEDVPEWVLIDMFLLRTTLHNAFDNCRMHGEKNGDVLCNVSAIGHLCFELENRPGPKHHENLELQDLKGRNTIIQDSESNRTQVPHVGHEQSTFMGMSEIKLFTELMCGTVALEFKPHQVVFALGLPLTPSDAPSEEQLPDGTIFVCADDDAAGRAGCKGLLKQARLNTNHDLSHILGKTYEEAINLPRVVMELAAVHGHRTVVCVFDQHMDRYMEGQVYGTDVTQKLREQGFKGVILIRSANDDPKSATSYRNAGATAHLSKSEPVAEVARTLVAQYHQWARYAW